MKLKVLDLFSGIGGMSLGLEATGGFETVGFCEIAPYPRAILAKHWPGVPIYNDVRNLEHEGQIDVICGGYPCQPFSVAGERRGEKDDRHLWPEMFNLIKKHRPAWVIGENVAGHVNMGLDEALFDLESENYSTRAFVIPACALDAQHRRDRVWIVGHTERVGQSGQREFEQPSNQASKGKGQTNHALPIGEYGKWCAEPDVGRVAYGIPNRMDRLTALGNAVVPQIVEKIGNAILSTYTNNKETDQ